MGLYKSHQKVFKSKNLSYIVNECLERPIRDRSMIKIPEIYKFFNKKQSKILRKQFEINQHWSKEDVRKLSEELKVDPSKVYKWNWNQKYKIQKTCENSLSIKNLDEISKSAEFDGTYSEYLD